MTDPTPASSSTRSVPQSNSDIPKWLGQRRSSGMVGWIVLGVALILLGLGVWWVVAQSGPSTSSPGAGKGGFGGKGGPPSVVNATKVEQGDMPVVISALGTVTPVATVTVKSQLSGLLMSVAFKEGQLVKKGQVLAQVDPRPYEQALAQAEGALAKDEAALQNAQADLRRYKMLSNEDSVARQTLDTQGSTVRQLEAQIKSDQAAVGAQKLNLTYARITAPVSGRVGLRQVDAGNYVSPGDTNGIVSIAETAPTDVAFSLPEDAVGQVAKAMAGSKIKVEAYDRSGATLLATGELSALDNLIDTTTGTLRAKARFSNADSALFPNQFVNVKVTIQTLKGTLIAPTSALLRGQQGMFVYVVDAARKAHIRPVQVGPAQGERSAILAGLALGETVVTDGSDRLREGATVVLPGACPPAGGKPGAGGWPGQGRAGGGTSGGAPCKPAGGGWGGGSGAGAPSASGGQAARGLLAGGQAPPAGVPAVSADRPAESPPQSATTPGGGGGAMRGRMEALFASLDLDAQQRPRAEAIFSDAFGRAMASVDPSDEDARRTAMRAARQEALAKLAPLLRPDQKAKLAAIQAQAAAGGPPQ